MADVREKLIKLLYHAPCESDLEGKPGSCSYRKCGQCGQVERLDYCSVVHLADHLIAGGVTVQQWIPVTERLPKGECIALGYQNEMLIGYIGDSEYSDTGYAAENDGEHLSDVTHWMPLPEPPKEETQ